MLTVGNPSRPLSEHVARKAIRVVEIGLGYGMVSSRALFAAKSGRSSVSYAIERITCLIHPKKEKEKNNTLLSFTCSIIFCVDLII